MINVIIFLLSLAGFGLLLLAMGRHQQEWLGRKLPASKGRRLRFVGFAALAAAFAAAGAGFGWAYGAVAWFGWLTAAAALIVIVNLNRELIMEKIRQ